MKPENVAFYEELLFIYRLKLYVLFISEEKKVAL